MENKQLTLGSLFDGSGGFPLGGLLTGQITPVWSSEIEPFAIRVTTKRLPQVKHSKNRYQLAHLLEKGHAKRGGGRVAGRPHIAPAEQAGIEQLQSIIEKALK